MTEVEDGKLSDFRPQKDNANAHTERGLKALSDAYGEVGYVAPMTAAANGEVLDGSARLEQAFDQFDDEALIIRHDGSRPIVMIREDVEDADDPRAKRISIGANRIGEIDLKWDAGQLLLDKEAGVDFSGLFYENEFDEITAEVKEEPPDLGPIEPSAVEKAQAVWQVKDGDIWQLGRHKIACGDCTDRVVVEWLMGGEKADMVFTDPPYNVANESSNFAANVSRSMDTLKNSDWDKGFKIAPLFQTLDAIMSDDCAVYICSSHWLVGEIWEWMESWADFYFYCIWCKPNPMPSLSKRHWTWATELIPYAVRGKHISNFPLTGHALNWWDIPKFKETDHPAEKVIGIPIKAIEFSSNRTSLVYDPFLGSGTTMVAAHQLGRRCFGIEISPLYVATCLQRFLDYAKVEPVLLSE